MALFEAASSKSRKPMVKALGPLGSRSYSKIQREILLHAKLANQSGKKCSGDSPDSSTLEFLLIGLGPGAMDHL